MQTVIFLKLDYTIHDLNADERDIRVDDKVDMFESGGGGVRVPFDIESYNYGVEEGGDGEGIHDSRIEFERGIGYDGADCVRMEDDVTFSYSDGGGEVLRDGRVEGIIVVGIGKVDVVCDGDHHGGNGESVILF
ncbi:hypothetical protein TanjilG_28283 [Lupinus angustifolius]|uniref:Uncharacterized protein n=1 Tax=Lupinus angustifolius TaxID=3871 RepID=A0A4P1RI46_LUPAN|nr:hypothetical protein TanjilG_28283 [Lupinus angustifolius]